MYSETNKWEREKNIENKIMIYFLFFVMITNKIYIYSLNIYDKSRCFYSTFFSLQGRG